MPWKMTPARQLGYSRMALKARDRGIAYWESLPEKEKQARRESLRKAATQKKRRAFPVHLTKEEREGLETQTEIAGLTLHQFCHRALVGLLGILVLIGCTTEPVSQTCRQYGFSPTSGNDTSWACDTVPAGGLPTRRIAGKGE